MTTNRTEKIEARVRNRERETVETAAEVEGVSVSAFIRRAALEAARRTLGASPRDMARPLAAGNDTELEGP